MHSRAWIARLAQVLLFVSGGMAWVLSCCWGGRVRDGDVRFAELVEVKGGDIELYFE